MQRTTFSLDDALAEAFDHMSVERGYANRSEAVREAVRNLMELWRAEDAAGAHCVASLSYIYNPRTRALAHRLAELQHAHHDLIAAVTSVPIDHDHTLESVLLRGPTAAVRALSDQVRAERGVRFGALNLVAVDPDEAHDHAAAHHHPGHAHLSPRAG